MKKTSGTFFAKLAAGAAKYKSKFNMVTAGLTKASKIGSVAGGVSNVARNWDRITASGVGEGLFRAANFFMAGSAGGQLAAIGTPLATLGGMAAGGLLNVEADFLTFDGTLDTREGLFRSFSRGALSALAGKSAAKSFLKGAKVKVGAEWTRSWWGAPLIGGTEKGLQTVLSNYDEYGAYGTTRFGGNFYAQAFAAGFLAGGLKEGADFGFKGLDNLINNKDVYLSLFSVGLSAVGAD